MAVLFKSFSKIPPNYLSLVPQSMDRDKSNDYVWFLIAQTQKIGVLQVVATNEDACEQNGKLLTSTSPIPSTYCYFNALQVQPQDLTCH